MVDLKDLSVDVLHGVDRAKLVFDREGNPKLAFEAVMKIVAPESKNR